jgi:glycine/D-amino acid oxidase-like deaminating enzyme
VTASGPRICVVGGGLAGCLLAWRLAGPAGTGATGAGGAVDLVLGTGVEDATAVSGGVVRGFEPDPLLARAAVESLTELRASSTLRRWADYREVGSLYLREAPPRASLAIVDWALPGSVELIGSERLARAGWSGLPAGCVGVAERHAGHLSPDALRRALLCDLAVRWPARLLTTDVTAVRPRPGGLVRCELGSISRDYDLVVLAAGRWTGRILRRSNLSAAGLRTKSVQYGVYAVAGQRPPPFVDETSGLYGRPVGGARMLLGMPVAAWDVDPDRPPAVAGAHADALRWAAVRLPRLRVTGTGAPAHTVGADSYAEPATLALRPVGGTAGRIVTFAGGSGGSAKTALAASRRAARQLTGALTASRRHAPTTAPATAPTSGGNRT